ncbi:peptide/nickel transport system ATP-binding protein [Catenibacillus scindens]|uniref:Peptide/nickel transport system ATP-binding protein n=1 Tax=Catenibacillus scindens TaxID=673271 RepID=A0A7W8HAE6_9FIRM|nr:ABC transporter ATP-binding protein [Catenibacillus scindens]MBB5264630.1 peptide/nickel transport system ATP-binding protein [Catenibacillus scindens]
MKNKLQQNISNKKLVEIKNLIVHYETDDGVVEAVNNVSFDIEKGEVLGLVGETGAGKTTIALSIMNLLPKPPAHVISGEIYLEGQDLMKKSKKELQKIRGKKISMVFQDPMTALNPVQTVGAQIAEVIQLHNSSMAPSEIKEHAVKMLETVGIPGTRYNDYPHQFSGGMKQRVVIAIALACEPELIIADEPTTALDVTIQAQVLELMKQLQKKFGTAMLLITHDFGVVADICNKCAVIYAGEIVEKGRVEHIFDHPMHPYTIGLFDSLPTMDKDVERLKPIKGAVADPTQLPPYCSFYDRCDYCTEECKRQNPALKEVEPGHFVKCIHEVRGKGDEDHGAD